MVSISPSQLKTCMGTGLKNFPKEPLHPFQPPCLFAIAHCGRQSGHKSVISPSRKSKKGALGFNSRVLKKNSFCKFFICLATAFLPVPAGGNRWWYKSLGHPDRGCMYRHRIWGFHVSIFHELLEVGSK